MGHSHDRQELNTDQIELHLKSAVYTLTPNILDRIDLSVPQDAPVPSALQARDDHLLALQRRMRRMALAAAACLCLVFTGGGAYHYQYLNRQVDSVIGIDVNPSVELSINRRNRVLSAQPLNEDAREILSEMDLEGVDLNVAVNAVIGSMVTHGYLDDLENAILVTVSNDSIRKATELRTSVVGDIEQTLKENQVQAVVYDQQVIEKDEMKEIAEAYGISYGKAYFLMELIDQNQALTMDDMEELSSLTMEEIAGRITESSLALGEFADKAKETTQAAAEQTTQETTVETTPETTEETTQTTGEETTQATTAETAPETTQAATTAAAEAPDQVQADRVKIDYAEYEDGMVYVYFVTHVKWKNPTVSVRDDEGNSYAALVEDTSSDECSISVEGLQGGKNYTFVLGGMTPKEGGSATTVVGYFEKPEIAGEVTEPEETEDESEDSTKDSSESAGNSGEENGTESSSGNQSGGGDGTEGSAPSGGSSSGVSGSGSGDSGSGGGSGVSGDNTAGGSGGSSSGAEAGKESTAGETSGTESTKEETASGAESAGEAE